MSPIAKLLTLPNRDWRIYANALPEMSIDAAQRRIGILLPIGLRELYEFCNSGEGSLPFQPWTFVLWGIDEVATLREHPHYREYYGELAFFGGNGGGEYFGLNPAGQIFIMDPIAGKSSIIVVADSFQEFANNIGTSPSVTSHTT